MLKRLLNLLIVLKNGDKITENDVKGLGWRIVENFIKIHNLFYFLKNRIASRNWK